LSGQYFELMDRDGNVIDNLIGTWKFKVQRSARRNLQSAGIMNVTMMHHPLVQLNGSTVTNLSQVFSIGIGDSDNAWRIINAGAVEYSDDWDVSCECGINSKEEDYNPYAINEKGVWRVKASRTYLAGRTYNQE